MKKSRQSRSYESKKPIQTQSAVGFLLFVVFAIVVILLYEQYWWYVVVVGICAGVWLYSIYKCFSYLQYRKLYTYNTFDVVRRMDPFKFEELCAEILLKLGYTDITLTPSDRDGWVDIRCRKDNLKYAVQCKRYNGTHRVSVEQMRALYGSAHPQWALGIMMTTGTCGQDATQYAKKNGIIIRDHTNFQKQFIQLLHTPLSLRARRKQHYL